MGRTALGLVLAAAALWAAAGEKQCAPAPLARILTERLQRWNSEERYRILLEPARVRRLHRELSAAVPDLELDHVACALAAGAAGRLETVRRLEALIEAYRSEPRPVEVSMVLMGVFSRLPDRVLLEVVDRYQARACRTPEPGRFELRVAADALASASREARIRFIESVLKLYGPGSAVYYKTEANDCLVIVDRELAYAALGTLPEELRKPYERRFEIFHR